MRLVKLVTMLRRLVVLGLIGALAFADSGVAAPIQGITGIVFVDYDRDGRLDPGERSDPALAGLSVVVHTERGSSVVALTASDGSFAVAVDRGPALIEFETPVGYRPTFSQTFGTAPAESATAVQSVEVTTSPTEVRYGIVPDSSCPVDPAGVGGPSVQSPDGNPNSPAGKVWVACFVDGARRAVGGPQDVLVGANYDATGWSPSNPDTGFGGNIEVEHIGTLPDLGSVWGVAYDEWDGVLYTSAAIKRHSELGPAGVDGLYWFDVGPDGTNLTPTSIDLESLSPADAPGFGADPVDCPLAENGASYDYDSFTTEASGLGDRWDCRDLGFQTVGGQNYDWWAFDRTGRAGIGDIDVTPDGDRLLVMNASADTVFVYDITGSTPAYLRHLSIRDPGCDAAEFEAWATTAVDAQTAFIGVTCTASSSGDLDDLASHVVALDVDSGEQTVVASVAYDYTHGPGWTTQPGPNQGAYQPWLALNGSALVPALPELANAAGIVYHDFLDAYGYANGWDYAQPLLSDIEVDPFDGSLVLAVTDRWAMMTGVFNCDLDPRTNGCGFEFPAPPVDDYDGEPGDDAVAGYTAGIIGYVAGDLLRMCNTADGDARPRYSLEGGPGCDPSVFSPTFEPPYGGGPAGAIEWYWNDQAFETVQTENAHPEAAQGAVYLRDRRDDVVYTAMNPLETFGAGLSWDSNTDGSHDNGFQLYRTDLDDRDGTAFKSAGLGDVEGCSIPLEVGNHIWFDANANGIREPGERPIPGVRVDLVNAATDVFVTSTMSDEHGDFFFGSADGLLPNTDYVFEFSSSELTDTGGLGVSRSELRETISDAGPSDVLDSDLRDGRLLFTTGAPGNNDHSLDAGFGPASELGDAFALEIRENDGDGGSLSALRIALFVFVILAIIVVALIFSLRWSWNRD